MKFEKGKTYRFSKEKFTKIFGEERTNTCWVQSIIDTEFTIEKEMEHGESVDVGVLGEKMKYSVVPEWCEEVG